MAFFNFNPQQNGVVTVGGNPFQSLFTHPAVTTADTGFVLAVQDRDITHEVTFQGEGLAYEMADGLITNITAGRITGTLEVTEGSIDYSITGLDISAVAFFDAVIADDLDFLLNAILGGDDQISGTDGRRGDVLGGGAGHDQVYGRRADDLLLGESGRDTLYGGFGDDSLNGGTGKDFLVGDSGSDTFVFDVRVIAANSDDLRDFNHAADTIELARAVFRGIGGSGALSEDAFHAGTAAADAEDRVIYQSATGRVLYDKDGLGGVDAVLFATVKAATTLDHTDFLIV